jgi:hypothetical protein
VIVVNLSDAVYATSTMDLRLRYFSQSARVPLHPIQYSLAGATIRQVTVSQTERFPLLYIRSDYHPSYAQSILYRTVHLVGYSGFYHFLGNN